ncbi:MAG: ATP-binding cassette domain-containing protein [Pontixanthobacter sp.]
MSFDLHIAKRLRDCAIDVACRSDERLIAISGPSGIGKTTMLNCIAGLVRPDSGRITIGGRTLFDAAHDIHLPPDARRCGYVFQDSRLFPHMSVSANLLYGSSRQHVAHKILTFDDAVELLGIGHLLDRSPSALSGGETKRVAIGRALLSAPDFLLLDEPLASLDSARGQDILTAIERIRDALSIPIIYVSHERSELDRLAAPIVTLD